MRNSCLCVYILAKKREEERGGAEDRCHVRSCQFYYSFTWTGIRATLFKHRPYANSLLGSYEVDTSWPTPWRGCAHAIYEFSYHSNWHQLEKKKNAPASYALLALSHLPLDPELTCSLRECFPGVLGNSCNRRKLLKWVCLASCFLKDVCAQGPKRWMKSCSLMDLAVFFCFFFFKRNTLNEDLRSVLSMNSSETVSRLMI